MSQLDEIKARLDAAPQGPLDVVVTGKRSWVYVLEHPGTAGEARIARCPDLDYAEFFARAPEDQRKLVAALEAVELGLAGLDEIFNAPSADDAAIRQIAAVLRGAIAEALA